jgi:hypothetical protein
MPATERPQITKTSFSRKVRRVLGLDLHSWEQWMLLALGLAAFAAVAVVVTTTSVVILTRHENAETKKEYAAYKLTVDGKVADAQKEGIEAGKTAGGALLKAAEANERATKAELELERLKASRTLTPEQQQRLVSKLQAFAGQKYSFNVFPDPEPIGLMRLIDNVLKTAGWIRIGSQIGDIVVEEAGTAHDSGIGIGIKRESSTVLQSIALQLTAALTWEELPSATSYIAELKFDDAININVGKKP